VFPLKKGTNHVTVEKEQNPVPGEAFNRIIDGQHVNPLSIAHILCRLNTATINSRAQKATNDNLNFVAVTVDQHWMEAVMFCSEKGTRAFRGLYQRSGK
jgi:hypothetical protein